MKTIALSNLPNIPHLVSDALEGKARVDYGFPLKINARFWKRKSREEAGQTRPREAIAERILAQAGDIEIPGPARRNIKALAEPGTLAVVTGQQIGLGGGPLLTFYKALTTIALARKLEAESGVRTVPVFWMATSDHNLVEAAQLHWVDLDNKLTGQKTLQADNRIPVGNLELGDHARELIASLKRDLPQSDFKPGLMEILEASYRPEATFGQAFMQLGYKMLGESGMVMLNPEDIEIKRACRPFWEQAVAEVDERLERLKQRSEQLQKNGYEIQTPVVKGRPSIFLLEDGIRRKVVLEGRSIHGQSDIIISRDELARIARDETERLSSGVTLRPLCQGFMLPAGAYVAGPHEMAYWSQLSDAFKPLGISKPAIVPRASFTLIEKKTRRWLDKLRMNPEDIFGDMAVIAEKIVQDNDENPSQETFEEVRATCKGTQGKLIKLASGAYGGLDLAVETAFNKIHYQLDNLENKFNRRLRRKHQDLLQGLDRLATHLLPAGRPQERVITPHYYIARYGWSLQDFITGHTLETMGVHGFLELEELS